MVPPWDARPPACLVAMLTHHEPAARADSRVVVLGGGGFVGGTLVRHLTSVGKPVLALGSGDVDLSQPDADQRLRVLVRPDDAVVFVSALTPDKGKGVPTLMNNLAMAGAVHRFLGDSKCAHLVYISSDAVYAEAASAINEGSCASPSSFHGLMHLVRERMLTDATGAEAIPLAILRPSLLYGPGDTHNGYGPNRFMRSARTDRVIRLFGNGEERRDHVYVEDLAQLIEMCLVHRSEGVLNVATGRSHSFGEVAEAVRALSDADVRIERLLRSGPVSHTSFDPSACQVAFPSFQYTDLQTGLTASLRGMA